MTAWTAPAIHVAFAATLEAVGVMPPAPLPVLPPVAGDGPLAERIDHTLLKPEATASQVRRLCAEAVEWGFATVCVNPVWVPLCADTLRGTRVGVCSVVGFPLGATLTAVKVCEAQTVIAAGATEVDMVIGVGALTTGDLHSVLADIAAVVAAALERGAHVKVIIETALLTDAEKVAACALAWAARAAFVKTSTGFGPGGATVEDVALMHQAVGGRMGIKAAGGIRTLAAARAMLRAGATRLGTSASLAILHEDRRETP